MKIFTNSVVCFLIAITCFSKIANGQDTPPAADYSFINFVHVSGTPMSVGAVYRFQNVCAGTDALVTITGAVGGAVLEEIDQTMAGFDAALQPRVAVPAGETGYIEFNIQFVEAGTSTPSVRNSVKATALDIDGNSNLKEFDEIDMGSTSQVQHDLTGSDVSVIQSGSFFRGQNIAGIEYSGIDLSSKARFTVSANNISSMVFRSGAINQDSYMSGRQRSIYFANFSYPTAMTLSVSDVRSFAVAKQGVDNRLSWELAPGHEVQHCVVESSADKVNFKTLAVVNTGAGSAFGYTDKINYGSVVYYRLKVVFRNSVVKYTGILSVKQEIVSASQSLLAYGTTSSLSIKTGRVDAGMAQLSIIDLGGKVIYKEAVRVQDGINYLNISPRTVNAGAYIVFLQTAKASCSTKVVLQ